MLVQWVVKEAMIGPICREEMRTLTSAYSEATGRSIDAISRKYYGKSGFLAKFIAGKMSMKISIYDRIMDDMRADLAALRQSGTSRTAVSVDN